MKTILTVRVDEELKRELERMSADKKKPVSDLVRESIEHYVAIHQFRNLRRKILPFAEAQGLLLDEDVFKITS